MNQSEWTDLQLGDLCAFKAGSAFPQAQQGLSEGDFPFIKVSDMNLVGNEVRIIAANNWVMLETATELKAKPLPEGTPIFAKIGEALKANRVRRLSRPTIVDNNMMGALPNETVVDEAFLFYLLQHLGLSRWATGTSVPYLTVSVLSQVPVHIPAIPIQQRIAAILSAYDDLIQNNTRRIAILEEMAQRLYEEWFVNFRFPGCEEVEFVSAETGMTPIDWPIVPLDEIVLVNPRTTVPREGFKPFVPMASLSEANMTIGPIEKREGNSGTKFQNGDTLVARITPCLENGKTGFVNFLDKEQPVAFGSTEFIVLRPLILGEHAIYCDPPPLKWSARIVRKRRIRYGN